MNVNHIMKTKPYKHQKDALDQAKHLRVFGFFMEMGTGKSKVLIDNIAYLRATKEINFALILAPKGVYRNWVEKEIPTHFTDTLEYKIMYWQSNRTMTYEKNLNEFFKKTTTAMSIFIMNIEAFSSPRGIKAGTWMAKKFGERGLIAIDESTAIKNPKAKRTKSLIKIGKDFKYKRILTGSPVTKSPLDLWSQFEFLDPGILGFPSYYAFLNRHANLLKRQLGSHSFQQIVGYKRLDELLEKIGLYIFRVLKKDCIDLPNKIYVTRYVQNTDEQNKMYKKIQQEAILLLDTAVVTAPMMITQMLRLQQILSGHLKSDDGRMLEFPTNRLNELLNICEETSGKMLIYSRFRYDIVSISNKLAQVYGKESVGCYYGDTTQEERVRVINAFEDKDNPMKFFVGNPSTAGYGITLNQANTVVYYANDFNLETRMQSEDRCHRIGQTNKVTYIDLISENTIDERIVKALKNKIDIGAKVLGEEARQWLQIDPKQKTML